MTTKKSTTQETLLDIEAGTLNGRAKKLPNNTDDGNGVYRELSKPFASHNDGNEAMRGFFRAVGIARREYGLPDVMVITRFNVQTPDGEGGAQGHFMFGDENNAEMLTAYAFGIETQKRKDHIARVLNDSEGTRKEL